MKDYNGFITRQKWQHMKERMRKKTETIIKRIEYRWIVINATEYSTFLVNKITDVSVYFAIRFEFFSNAIKPDRNRWNEQSPDEYSSEAYPLCTSSSPPPPTSVSHSWIFEYQCIASEQYNRIFHKWNASHWKAVEYFPRWITKFLRAFKKW